MFINKNYVVYNKNLDLLCKKNIVNKYKKCKKNMLYNITCTNQSNYCEYSKLNCI